MQKNTKNITLDKNINHGKKSTLNQEDYRKKDNISKQKCNIDPEDFGKQKNIYEQEDILEQDCVYEDEEKEDTFEIKSREKVCLSREGSRRGTRECPVKNSIESFYEKDENLQKSLSNSNSESNLDLTDESLIEFNLETLLEAIQLNKKEVLENIIKLSSSKDLNQYCNKKESASKDCTPLAVACFCGNYEIIKLMIGYDKIDRNKGTKCNSKPIDIVIGLVNSSTKNKIKIMNAMFKLGIIINPTTVNCAKFENNKDITYLLQKKLIKQARKLIAKAKIDYKNGENPVNEIRDTEKIERLLKLFNEN